MLAAAFAIALVLGYVGFRKAWTSRQFKQNGIEIYRMGGPVAAYIIDDAVVSFLPERPKDKRTTRSIKKVDIRSIKVADKAFAEAKGFNSMLLVSSSREGTTSEAWFSFEGPDGTRFISALRADPAISNELWGAVSSHPKTD